MISQKEPFDISASKMRMNLCYDIVIEDQFWFWAREKMTIEIKSMFCELRNIFKDVLITPDNRIHLVTKLLSHLVDYRKRRRDSSKSQKI